MASRSIFGSTNGRKQLIEGFRTCQSRFDFAGGFFVLFLVGGGGCGGKVF